MGLEDLRTDGQLLTAYRAGSEEAFGTLYRRASEGLHLYALSLVWNPAQAEDLVQEAFAALLRQGDPEGAVRAFLAAVIRNRAIDLARHAQVERRERARLLVEAREGEPPAGEEELERLNRALDALPDEQRETIVLKIYNGMTFEEVAGAAGIPLKTAISRYRYGIAAMARRLSEDGP